MDCVREIGFADRAVARALAAVAAGGRTGFYEGEFGEALLARGAGEFTADDLSRRQAGWVEAVGVDAFDQRLWTLPPNSQGYILLRVAAVASGLTLPDPDDPEWAHQLIECARLAAVDRDMVWHEYSDPDALIASAALDAMRARVTLICEFHAFMQATIVVHRPARATMLALAG
jgi:gamma-glutamyltranspeptidase / glutathione hydrolase